MLKKILAPTDFSDLSVRGVRYACQLGKDVGAEVTILNVVIVDESGIDKREMKEHKQRLNEFVAKNVADVGSNLRIRKVVDAGQPYGAIVDCAENERIDLIVMSSHGNPKRDSFRFCLRCELNELTRIASAGRMVGW